MKHLHLKSIYIIIKQVLLVDIVILVLAGIFMYLKQSSFDVLYSKVVIIFGIITMSINVLAFFGSDISTRGFEYQFCRMASGLSESERNRQDRRDRRCNPSLFLVTILSGGLAILIGCILSP